VASSFGTQPARRRVVSRAPAIARRFGLLNTMVFTHLPSNFLLLLVPLMPNVELAVLMLLVRNSLSQLDVPTRQSYTMACRRCRQRAASAGILLSRPQRGPLPSRRCLLAQYWQFDTGIAVLVGGGLKIIYDLWVFAVFRNV